MLNITKPMVGRVPALDQDKITKACAAADLRPLLMTLAHRTGDDVWLSDRYRPKRDVQLITDEDAGIDDDAADEIRSAAQSVLSQDYDAPSALEELGDERLHRMMEFFLNESVPEEYIPMMREQLGFRSPLDGVEPLQSREIFQDTDIAIVGAGQSGVAMAACLSDLDVSYTILDRRHDIGGVWSQNIYPGCGVDTPNYAYSYSFGDRFPWSRNFSPQEEVKDYLQQAARSFGVEGNVQQGTEIVEATWDEADKSWQLKLNTPEGPKSYATPFLITATGLLSNPVTPDIPGMADFSGDLFHSADWPEGYDLKGKNIAIVGTGASAMQIAPTIADEVASLTIYQRTAQWVRPIARYHDPIDPDVQWLLEQEPHYAAWTRFGMFWRYGDGLLKTLKIDPEWEHPARAVNRTNDRQREVVERHIREKLASRPDLIEKCIPDYPIFGKRILLDNGWYDALLKPNVSLITDRIEGFDASGITTNNGEHSAFDTIVMSTGFDVAGGASRLNITGRNGVKLSDLWKGDNPSAYLGMMVPEFPNLFIMQGPGTGLGHGGSAIFVSECQAHFIARALSEVSQRKAQTIEVRRDPYHDYVRKFDQRHNELIWSHPGMQPYYRNSSGRVHSVMPWRLVDYYHMTHDFAEQDFDID